MKSCVSVIKEVIKCFNTCPFGKIIVLYELRQVGRRKILPFENG